MLPNKRVHNSGGRSYAGNLENGIASVNCAKLNLVYKTPKATTLKQIDANIATLLW